MSLSTGAFHVLFIIQKFVPLPFLADIKRQRLIKNQFKLNPHHYLYKIFSEITILFVMLPIALFRISWLIIHWKSYTTFNIDEFIVYGILTCVILIYLPACIVFHTDSSWIIAVINNLCEIGLQLQQDERNKSKKILRYFLGVKTIKPVFAYCLAIPVLCLALAFAAAALSFSYLPINLVFGQHPVVKIVSAILYGSLTAYGGFSCFTTFLLFMIFFEHVIQFSSKTCQNMFKNYNTKIFFINCYRYRMTQIFLKWYSSLFSLFFANVIFIGILLGSCGAYWTIKMFNKVNFVIFILGPSMSSLCCVIAIVFTHMAGLPYKNSQKFKNISVSCLRKKEERQTLRSLKSCGLQLQPYGVCTSKLGVLIVDNIIQNTVDALLFDSS